MKERRGCWLSAERRGEFEEFERKMSMIGGIDEFGSLWRWIGIEEAGS